MWFAEGMLASATLPLSPARIYRLLKLFAYDRLALKGATERISAEREDLLGNGPTRRLLPYLGMCEDAADGELVLDGDGQLDLRWSPAASRQRFFELEAGMRELSKALGGAYLSSPLWDPPTRELLTAHPLGGCVMADDSEHGVVDPRGAVYGYPGLFVADASVIATPLARNPSATISALAERTAFHMLHDREIRRDDWPAPK